MLELKKKKISINLKYIYIIELINKKFAKRTMKKYKKIIKYLKMKINKKNINENIKIALKKYALINEKLRNKKQNKFIIWKLNDLKIIIKIMHKNLKYYKI